MMRIWKIQWKREMSPHLKREPSPPANGRRIRSGLQKKYNSEVDKLHMPVSSFLYIALIFYAEMYPDYIIVHVLFL